MRRRDGSTSIIAVLVLALSAGSSFAADWTVTTTADDAAAPPAGSLRAVIAAAAPGDRIRFSVSGPIALAAELDVPAGRNGLRIVGPVSFAPLGTKLVIVDHRLQPADPARIVVRSAGVRLERIDFSSIPVAVEADGGGTRILGCRFEGKWGGVRVTGAADVEIGSLSRPNRFVGFDYASADVRSIVLDADRGTRIVGNRFEGNMSGVLTHLSEDLLVTLNVVRGGGIEGDPATASVIANKIALKTGDAVLLRDYPTQRLPGLVTVAGNAVSCSGRYGASGITVIRESCVVAANRVRCRYIEGLGSCIGVAARSALVAGNVVRGGEMGIGVGAFDDPAADVRVVANVVSRVGGYGFSINAGRSGAVHFAANAAVRGVPSLGGDATGVVLVSHGGSIVAEYAAVSGAARYGVQVHGRGGTIDLRDFAVGASGADGVIVHEGNGLVRIAGGFVGPNASAGYRFESGSHGDLTPGLTFGNGGGDVVVEEGADVVVR
jgi:hypothetical protein